MIRLRYADGKRVDVSSDEIPFVEIVNDLDGTIGLLYIQLEPGVLLEVKPGSADAVRYEALMSKHGVRFATTMIHRQAP